MGKLFSILALGGLSLMACGGTADDADDADGTGGAAAGGMATNGGSGAATAGGADSGGGSGGAPSGSACPTGGPTSQLPAECPDISCRPLFPWVGPWLYGAPVCTIDGFYPETATVIYEGGNATRVVDAATGTVTYEAYQYDGRGRVASWMETPPGQPSANVVVTYGADDGTVVATRTTDGGGTRVDTYQRDSKGYPLLVITTTGTDPLSYRYEYEGCRLTRRVAQGSASDAGNLMYGYDPDGNMTTVGSSAFTPCP